MIGEVAALDLAWFETPAAVRPARRRRREPRAGVGAQRTARGARRRGRRAAGDRDRRPGRRRRRTSTSRGRHRQLRLAGRSRRRTARVASSLRCTTRGDLGGVQVAAIGPGTAEALRQGNIRADLVPDAVRRRSVAWTSSRRPPDRCQRAACCWRGPQSRATCCRTGCGAHGWARRRRGRIQDRRGGAISPKQLAAAPRPADVITFTSSSTVERYLEVAGPDDVPADRRLHRPDHRRHRALAALHVDIEAPVHSIAGLVDAIVEPLRRRMTARAVGCRRCRWRSLILVAVHERSRRGSAHADHDARPWRRPRPDDHHVHDAAERRGRAEPGHPHGRPRRAHGRHRGARAAVVHRLEPQRRSPRGFEYDLAKSLAARLGVSSVRVVVTPLGHVAQRSGLQVRPDAERGRGHRQPRLGTPTSPSPT